MKLTLLNRLRICFEVLTIRSGHKHHSQEKQLTTFQNGYAAGYADKAREWPYQARRVRNYSNPDDVFEAVPLSIMDCER